RLRIRKRLSVADIEGEHHGSHRLEEDHGPRSRPDSTAVVARPPVRGRDERRTRHLNMRKHRVERRVEPKPGDEARQTIERFATRVLAGELKQFIERALRAVSIPLRRPRLNGVRLLEQRLLSCAITDFRRVWPVAGYLRARGHA